MLIQDSSRPQFYRCKAKVYPTYMLLFFILYQHIQLLLLPLIPWYILFRAIQKKPIFGNFFERIGFVPKSHDAKVVWIHAVSVGEVLSIEHLIKKIKQKSPDTKIYLTVGTITGKKIAEKQIQADTISFLPYDFLIPMLLAFFRIKPEKIIIVEAEIWPNLLMLAHYKKIPLYLINARISKRSKGRYQTLQCILAPILNLFTNIYTQSKADEIAFESIGVAKEKLATWGNIKTYNVIKKRDAITHPITKPANWITLLVGSLHPGELNIYLKLFKQLKAGPNGSKIKMILAPRHFHWKEELVRKVRETGFPHTLWDEDKGISSDWGKSYDLLLVCKLGELFTLYPQSDLFFLGGTFVPVGGHNLLEPAAWGVPTVVGPHHFNSETIAKDLLTHDGLAIAKKRDDLYQIVSTLLQDQIKLQVIGSNAQAWLEKEASLIETKLYQFLSEIT